MANEIKGVILTAEQRLKGFSLDEPSDHIWGNVNPNRSNDLKPKSNKNLPWGWQEIGPPGSGDYIGPYIPLNEA